MFEAHLVAAEAEFYWAIADTTLVGDGITPEEISVLASANISALLLPLLKSLELCIYQVVTFAKQLIASVFAAASSLSHFYKTVGDSTEMHTVIVHF